ncbi:MAG: hypothetical protein ACT4PL_06990 [Phycisphaerales bacterium]
MGTRPIVDARGTVRRIPAITVLSMTDETVVGGLMTLRAAQWRAGRRKHTTFSTSVILACVSVPIAAGVVLLLLPRSGWAQAAEVCKWAMVIGLVATPLAAHLCSRRPTAEDARPFVRACGKCLACGYDLSGTPAQADGCVICPECGAAWLV